MNSIPVADVTMTRPDDWPIRLGPPSFAFISLDGIQFVVCKDCGATVIDGAGANFRDQHVEWHRQLAWNLGIPMAWDR